LIYFDNGATTFPKPLSVRRAVAYAMQNAGANPGRSGHSLSLRASQLIYDCRENAARLLGVPSPENIIFTLNCTTALNTVIHGVLKKGDHAVISSLEHNAVLRPLRDMEKLGVTHTAVSVVPGDNDATLDAFRRAIRENTRLFIVTHASNVWGIRLPVERLAALAHACARARGMATERFFKNLRMTTWLSYHARTRARRGVHNSRRVCPHGTCRVCPRRNERARRTRCALLAFIHLDFSLCCVL
jgi:aspartate/methionine/tyrosine aminotransferase